MTSIGTVANQIGVIDRPGELAVTMAVVNGQIKHAYLKDAAEIDADAEWFQALYLAGGLFKDGSLRGNTGRSRANLTRVLYLQFDADLLDFFGATGNSSEEKEARLELLRELGDMPQTELDEQISLLRAAVEETFSALRFPIHRLDYTGYGLCAYAYISESDQTRIDDAVAAHAHVVNCVNRHYGHPLLDAQVSDAGTRVTRLPGSLNTKGAIPRIVTTLVPWDGSTIPLGRRPDANRPITQMIPTSGPGLTPDDVQSFIAAVSPSWNLGQKHAMGVATAGLLAKGRVPEEQALQIIEQLSSGDAKPWDRRNAVSSTYARMRAGGAVAGYSILANLMPAAAVQFVDQLLERYRSVSSGPVTVGAFDVVGTSTKSNREPDIVSLVKTTPLPSSCMVGWVKTYVELMEPLSETADAFNFACGLALAGSTFGRTVSARYIAKSLHPNLYLMLVGSAGTSRKDTAIRLALEMPTYIAPPLRTHTAPFTVATDIGSAEGLIKLLQERPNTLLYITEYQRLSQNAHRQSTGTIFTMLTSAWDTPVALQNITKGSPLEAKFPFLSVLAAVQPAILANEMQQSDIESGYATRWLFVPGVGKPARPEPPDVDERSAFDLYDHLLRRRKDYENRDGMKFYLSETAKARWIDWYEQDRDRVLASEDEDAMRSRLGVHVRKVALIYAALDGADVIDLHHLEPAISFVEWSWLHTRELMKGWGVGLWSQVENRIEQVLKERQGLQRRELQQLCRGRKWSSREFAMVLDSMMKNGTVEIDPVGVLRWAS